MAGTGALSFVRDLACFPDPCLPLHVLRIVVFLQLFPDHHLSLAFFRIIVFRCLFWEHRLSLPFSGSSSFVAHPHRHHQSSNKVFYPLKEIHYRLTEQNGKKCSPQQPFICFHIRLTISQINSFLINFGFVFSLCLRIQPGTKV